MRSTNRNDRKRLVNSPVLFNETQRQIVDRAIREVCRYRAWSLHRLEVRTNHVHLIVTTTVPPDKVLGDCKSYATRRLRETGEFEQKTVIWAEKGSKRWLNDERSFHLACDYVDNQ